MESFPVLGKDELDAQQRVLWDELTLGPRGFFTGGAAAKRLPDLYNAWLQFPEFGRLMLQLASEIRLHSELPGKLRELVIITTAVLLNARVEFDFHSGFARNEGLSDAVIAAIGEGTRPPFADEAERILFDATVELVETATLSPRAREEVVKTIGYRGLLQFIAVIGLYTIVSYTTNICDVGMAADFSADSTKLSNFFAGKNPGEE